MKKLILFAVLALVPSLASAQLPEPIEGLLNPNIVMGAAYLENDPGEGLSRVHFLLTANIVGVKAGSLPLYIGGVGVDLRTIDEAFGEISGVGLSVPILTYAFNGDQFVAQVGYAKDLTGDPRSQAIYAGIGFSYSSPNQMAQKRAEKAQKKAAQLLLSHPTQVAAK